MGHIFTGKDSKAYFAWRNLASPHDPMNLGKEILAELLAPRPGDSILDIGCGIGEILEYCRSLSMDTTGIDPSRAMLHYASERMENHATLYACRAENLPFDDNSFNYACFFASLEFVSDPEKALAEAFRVAKDKVFIGLLNPYALRGLSSRIQMLWGQGIYAHARFFSLWEILSMVRKLLGDVPVSWRSTGFLPQAIPGAGFLDHLPLAKKFPFGAFMGIAVTPVPRFRLTPLSLSSSEEKTYKKELAGLTAESTKKASPFPPEPE
ncbi:methyltransferase domain-containing protein [Desulfococcaceae bacterium OttesenSCG-928-F15]|nr:methyltransferase domain-containing protein [Desulfococcaceae bacterium OttesenSCG-928-F15]